MQVHPLSYALAFGKRNLLDYDLAFQMDRLGLSHLLSASAFHLIAIIFLLRIIGQFCFSCASYVSPFLRYSFNQKIGLFCFESIVLLYFVHSCQWAQPVLRAYIFIFCYRCASLYSLKIEQVYLISFVALFTILLTQQFKSASLSNIAVFALLVARSNGSSKYVQYLLISILPWLWSIPIISLYFYQISWLAPFVNLVFLPLISIGIIYPTILFLLAKQIGLDSEYLSYAINKACQFFVLVTGKIVELPHTLSWIDAKSFYIILFALILIYLCFRWKLGVFTRKNAIFLACLQFVAIYSLYFLKNMEFHKSNFAVLDVGQGDAILLNSITQKKIKRVLVDFGPSSFGAYPSPVAQELAAEGVSQLDEIIISHPDSDHIGGANPLLKRVQLKGSIWVNPIHLSQRRILLFLEIVESLNYPIRFIQGLKLFKNMGLACRTPIFKRWQSSNSNSIVCRYQPHKNGKSLLLTGDMDKKSETFFLKSWPEFIQSSFLKIAHHGSNTSSSHDFLDRNQAKFAIISSGKQNRFGHPNSRVLLRLRSKNIQIFNTAERGTIRFEL